MRQTNIRNFIILLIEIVLIFLMALKIIPLEASLFLTGLLIFYFLFSPLADSLWLFIASIPLFVALPISESFNSMSNWRILLAVLFLVLFFKSGISISLIKNNSGKWRLKENLKHYSMEYLVGIFLLIGCISLLVADDIWIGIKKLLFLINIFLLFIIIRNLANKNKEIIFKIINAVGVALGLTLLIGYTQFISVFFVPLYNFWQFWAKNVIPIFYGQALSQLLSYSNTWFSYYAEALPTLRMFSVFPDSHSFALFLILGLPFLIALIVILEGAKRPIGSRSKQLYIYCLILLSLLAAILSGSRGVWVSALIPLALLISIVILRRANFSLSLRGVLTKVRMTKQSRDNQIKLPKILLSSLIIFFLLFPVSSLLLTLSQRAQGAISGQETDLIFARAKSILNLSELSAKSRIEIWQRTLDSIAAHPILGVGIGNYPAIIGEEMSAAKRGASAHNLYLDITAEMGIFALLILLLIFWQILQRAWQVFTQSKDLFFKTFAAAFALYFVWLLAYNLFDVVLLNDKVLLLFTLAIGLLYSIPQDPRSKDSRTVL